MKIETTITYTEAKMMLTGIKMLRAAVAHTPENWEPKDRSDLERLHLKLEELIRRWPSRLGEQLWHGSKST